MASSKRITTEDLDKRLVVKLNKQIKAVSDGVHGLMSFGDENNYPQMIELVINGSVTAKAAAGIYSKFLSGTGFENEAINNIIVGTDQRGKEITVRSLLRQVAYSCAVNNGFYVHCNKNKIGQTGTVHLKPFKDGRFAKPDDTGFSAKMLFYNNWDKNKDVGKYDTKEANIYPIFSNKVTVTQSQIKEAGEKFKGQIFFQFLDDTYFYPLSPFDAAYMDADTEQQVSLYKNRTVRNGFFDKTIIRKQKEYKPERTTNIQGDQNDPMLRQLEQDSQTADDIVDFIGADGERVIVIEDDIDPDTGEFPKNTFEVKNIKAEVSADLFADWEKGLKNNIRMSIQGIPAVLIDYEQGSLGTTSGEAIIQARDFYNALTDEARGIISESFAQIFRNSVIPELKDNKNWKIKPFKLLDDVTNTSGATSN